MRKIETCTIQTVNCRHEKKLPGKQLGHFGSQLAYTNKPNFNLFLRYLTRNTYGNNETVTIKPVDCRVFTRNVDWLFTDSEYAGISPV